MIFVVDIIPTIKTDKTDKVKDIYTHFSSTTNSLGSQKEWINEICSENAIICQYKPLDPELILKALSEYLNYWKELYLNTTIPILDEYKINEITRNILNFKKILHANDAGLEIYLKKFGREALTAIESAALGAYPSLEIQEPQNLVEFSEQINSTINSDFNWSKEAEDYLQDAPKFVRSKIRSNAEKKAKELGINEITRNFVENLRK